MGRHIVSSGAPAASSVGREAKPRLGWPRRGTGRGGSPCSSGTRGRRSATSFCGSDADGGAGADLSGPGIGLPTNYGLLLMCVGGEARGWRRRRCAVGCRWPGGVDQCWGLLCLPLGTLDAGGEVGPRGVREEVAPPRPREAVRSLAAPPMRAGVRSGKYAPPASPAALAWIDGGRATRLAWRPVTARRWLPVRVMTTKGACLGDAHPGPDHRVPTCPAPAPGERRGGNSSTSSSARAPYDRRCVWRARPGGTVLLGSTVGGRTGRGGPLLAGCCVCRAAGAAGACRQWLSGAPVLSD